MKYPNEIRIGTMIYFRVSDRTFLENAHPEGSFQDIAVGNIILIN